MHYDVVQSHQSLDLIQSPVREKLQECDNWNKIHLFHHRHHCQCDNWIGTRFWICCHLSSRIKIFALNYLADLTSVLVNTIRKGEDWDMPIIIYKVKRRYIIGLSIVCWCVVYIELSQKCGIFYFLDLKLINTGIVIITTTTIHYQHHHHHDGTRNLKSRMVKQLNERYCGCTDHHWVRWVNAVEDLIRFMVRIKLSPIIHQSSIFFSHLCSTRLDHRVPNRWHGAFNRIPST